MQVFNELGALVEDRWRASNYSDKVFPDIAAEALESADFCERVDAWEIIRWVQSASSLPDQKDPEGSFGNPPITLFSGPRFYIDVYYWLDGTTTIHQHSFCGAFQVLLGSSLHSRYTFEELHKINEHFSIGEIALQSIEQLKQSDVRRILPGREFIHSLFHLDRPSATVTIRTEASQAAGVQYSYRKPYIASDPFYRNPVMMKKLQSVSLLLGTRHTEADSMITDAVRRSDFQTAYLILEETFYHLKHNQISDLFNLPTGRDRFATILDEARRVHGELVDVVLPVLEEQERQLRIVERRRTITSEEHRFFLALLLNVPDRKRILELVGQQYPAQDPGETVLDWIEDLSRTVVLPTQSSTALGIPALNNDSIFAIEALLKGLQPTIEKDAKDIRAELKNSILNPLFEKI